MRDIVVLIGLIVASCATQNMEESSNIAAINSESCAVSIKGDEYVLRTEVNEITVSLGKCKACLTSGFEYAVDDSLLFMPIQEHYSGKPVKIALEKQIPGKHGVYVRANCISDKIHVFYFNVGPKP